MPTDRLTPGLTAEIVTTVDDKLVRRNEAPSSGIQMP